MRVHSKLPTPCNGSHCVCVSLSCLPFTTLFQVLEFRVTSVYKNCHSLFLPNGIFGFWIFDRFFMSILVFILCRFFLTVPNYKLVFWIFFVFFRISQRKSWRWMMNIFRAFQRSSVFLSYCVILMTSFLMEYWKVCSIFSSYFLYYFRTFHTRRGYRYVANRRTRIPSGSLLINVFDQHTTLVSGSCLLCLCGHSTNIYRIHYYVPRNLVETSTQKNHKRMRDF